MKRGQSATKRGSSLESDQVGTLISLTCSSSAVSNTFLLFILRELYKVHGTLCSGLNSLRYLGKANI